MNNQESNCKEAKNFLLCESLSFQEEKFFEKTVILFGVILLFLREIPQDI